MTPFLTVSFAILPRSSPKGHRYEKGGTPPFFTFIFSIFLLSIAFYEPPLAASRSA
jgi:hypothetical protein